MTISFINIDKKLNKAAFEIIYFSTFAFVFDHCKKTSGKLIGQAFLTRHYRLVFIDIIFSILPFSSINASLCAFKSTRCHNSQIALSQCATAYQKSDIALKAIPVS